MLKKIKKFLFVNSTLRQTVAKNTFWLAVGQIGGRLLRTAIIIYAARILGAGEWGVFSYAINLVAMLTVFIDLGIGPILIREVSKTNDPIIRSKVLSTSLFIKLALLSLGVLITLFIAPSFTKIEAAKTLLPIISLILIFDTLREFGFSLSRALEKMEWEAGLFALTNVAIVGFGFFFLYLSPTVTSFTYSYAAGTGIGMFATFFALRHHFKDIFYHFSKNYIKPIFVSALPFAISGVLGSLMINTDIFFIGFFRTAEELGFYSAAQRPIQLLYMLPALLATSIFPAFSRLAHTDKEKMRSIVERSVCITLLAALPIAVGGIIIAPQFMELLFGNEYLPGTSSFQVLLLSTIIVFPLSIVTSAIAVYEKKEKLLIYYVALGGILNVILDILFIPKIGIVGSAWATLISQSISGIYLWWRLRHITGFRIVSYLKNIILATIFMSVLVLLLNYLRINIFIILGTAILAYFGILYWKREFLLKEVKLILRPNVSSEQENSASYL